MIRGGGAATDGADVAPALSRAAALRCHLYGVSGVADRLDARAAAAADAGGARPGFFGLAHTMGMAKVGARGAVNPADGGRGRMKAPHGPAQLIIGPPFAPLPYRAEVKQFHSGEKPGLGVGFSSPGPFLSEDVWFGGRG